MEAVIQERSTNWLTGNFDAATKDAIKKMQAENPKELADSFYRNLEFGTGGLRGIMGVGTNRMNKYTVGMATQGFANYLNQTYPGGPVRVAIAHDCRNNSRFFAETTANVFAANGIKVFLFSELRPTPELSFAIRHLGCQGGVVCTASHNPKEYNGYKAYWNDGGQLVPPHDKNVIKEVGRNINANKEFKDDGKKLLHNYISVEELRACTTCNACVEECPVSISPLEIILELRRSLVMEESNAPQEWNAMFSNVENNFAPWKFSPDERDKWTQEV